jgi:hypothetical protein
MASRETAKMENSLSVPKMTATPEDQEAKSPELPSSPPPSTSNKAQNENSNHQSSSSAEPRKKKIQKGKES